MLPALTAAFAMMFSVALVAAPPAETRSEPSSKTQAALPETEAQRLEPGPSLSAKNLSIEGLEVEPRSRGGVKVHLAGRFRHSLVLVIAPDGSMLVECVDSPEREAQLFRWPPAAVKSEER